MGTEESLNDQFASAGQDGTDAKIRTIIDEIHKVFARRLADSGSVVADDPGLSGEIFEQVDAILGEVLAVRSSGAFAPTVLQADRARREANPVASLQAASELFDVALPIIARHQGLENSEIVDLSLRLHKAVMGRIAFTALPYVEYLLTKIHSSSKRERTRISRDLHDGAAHEIIVGLQHFDMFSYFSDTNDSRAAREFEAGIASLNEALRTVQDLSKELRKSVGGNGLKAAVKHYLRDSVPDAIRTELDFTGNEKLLPPPVSEELFLIIREACRNAVMHGRPSELRLTVEVAEHAVTAVVSDDGQGFNAGASGETSGGGLPSMAERVEVLNGVLRVRSEIGEGATITVRVPLPGDPAR